ncbi:MAG: Flp pilus assembly complex ATPase component TadA [Acidobacteriia bacterium]|nr:Flp pilus assembly complex ATPase component TadA [Terriglobia bacterium]
MRKKKLGEILRERGLISADDLAKALEEQQRKVILLGEVLLERNLVSREDLVASIEEVTKVAFIDCRSAKVDPHALKLVPHDLAARYGVLPIALDGKKIVVAMAEPQNLQAIDELRFRTGKVVSPRLGFRMEIVASIERHYHGAVEPGKGSPEQESSPLENVDISHVQFISGSARQSSQEALLEIQAELKSKPTPAVRLVSAAIAAAVEKDASDIHIEPQTTGMAIRMRVDGILRELAQVPAEHQSTVISRLKILADMDIAERRKPQDGRIVVRVGSKNIDLRISTLPTHHGEKMVIRLLDPSAPRLRFHDLGMTASKCETLNRLIGRPQGMLLVTGPTGSGKTTTLYAALNQLRSPSVNIVTVEDPVEYMLEGINQVQVHTKAGLTFAQCLRSILRQDPNIIMVGEIRDAETAEIAMKASQTGHLVLTTVHTNDAIAAIARLVDLKIPSSLIASSVTAVMSQRLVRKLCSCRQKVAATPEYVAHLVAAGMDDSEKIMYVPGSCPACDHSGYRGRVIVSEILVFDEEMRHMIRTDTRPDQIRVIARGKGMRTMQEDALDRVKDGLTSLDEILRVITFEEFSGARCSKCSRELAEMFLFCPYCGTKRSSNVVSDPVPVHAGPGGDFS